MPLMNIIARNMILNRSLWQSTMLSEYGVFATRNQQQINCQDKSFSTSRSPFASAFFIYRRSHSDVIARTLCVWAICLICCVCVCVSDTISLRCHYDEILYAFDGERHEKLYSWRSSTRTDSLNSVECRCVRAINYLLRTRLGCGPMLNCIHPL